MHHLTLHHPTLAGLLACCCAALPGQDFWFTSARNSTPVGLRYDIHRYDDTTGAQILLRTSPCIDQHPVAIGGRVWFTRTVLAGHQELHSMLPDGTDVRRETWDGGDDGWHGNSHPFPIPGTTDVLMTTHRERGGSVLRRMTAGGGITVLVDDGFDAEVGHSPSDGTFVYYSSDVDGDFEIYRRHLGTGATVQLTANTTYDSGVALDPTGNSLVYTAADPVDPCATQLWTMDWQGNGKQQRTFDAGNRWAFLFDGTNITYVSNQDATVVDPGHQIRRLDLVSNTQTVLVDSGSDDVHLLGHPACGLPVAEVELEADRTFGPPGTTVHFAASWRDWPFTSCTFRFGDGSPDVTVTSASPATVAHTYLAAGTFHPTVTAFDTCTPPNTGVAALPTVTIHDYQLDLLTGAPLGLGDDSVVDVALGFSFPFPGPGGPVAVSSVRVDSNGRLTMPGVGSSLWSPSIGQLLGAPGICPLWTDIDPSSPLSDGVYLATAPGRATITWRDCVRYSGSQPFTMQVQLFADGRVLAAYDSRVPDAIGLIGISDGNGLASPGAIRVGEVPIDTGAGSQAFYDYRSRLTGEVRGRGLAFTPDASGSWRIDAVFLPFAEVEALGVGCPATLRYEAANPPRLGTVFSAELVGAAPGGLVLHVIGYQNPGLALGLGDCRLWSSAESIGVALADLAGASSSPLAIPNAPSLATAQLFLQGATTSPLSPLGIALSNGLVTTLGF